MKYIITERQYRLLTEEPEEILEIPYEAFDYDWDLLQKFLERRGNPPYKLIGNLDLSGFNIKSLGNLQSVGGDLFLKDTPLSKTTTEEEIISQVEVEGIIYL